MNEQPSVTLKLALKPGKIALLFPLLQEGFQVAATVGCNIHDLLCDGLGMRPDYLSDRINTIFLNGRPVDDVKTAIVDDGATLALSAAMPGLVGATLRKAGCLAVFRGAITHRKEDHAREACHSGFVKLKLFNLLLGEIGPLFLARGIWVSGRALRPFFAMVPTTVDRMVVTITKDGIRCTPDEMADLTRVAPDARFYLQVTDDG